MERFRQTYDIPNNQFSQKMEHAVEQQNWLKFMYGRNLQKKLN